MLRWHYRLGNVGFDRVKVLLRSGALATSTATRRLHRLACKDDLPKCSTCQYAKQRLRSSPDKKSAIVADRAGVIRKNNLMLGQEVSVDHFMCSEKGRLCTSRGKTADRDMYAGGCIFVEHASNYIQVEFQTTLSSHATIMNLIVLIMEWWSINISQTTDQHSRVPRSLSTSTYFAK